MVEASHLSSTAIAPAEDETAEAIDEIDDRA